jgi:hypothetical protein
MINAMSRMTIKDIECDPQDLTEIFLPDKLDIYSYLGAPKPVKLIPIFWIWLIVPLFLILASCIWIGIFNPTWTKVSIIGVFALYSFMLIVVHYNYRNWSLTSIVVFGGLILLLLSLNVYTPQEIAKKIETNTVSKYSK